MLRSTLKRQHGRKQRCTPEQLALHMTLTWPDYCCKDEYGQTRGMWILRKLQGYGKHRACNTLTTQLQQLCKKASGPHLSLDGID